MHFCFSTCLVAVFKSLVDNILIVNLSIISPPVGVKKASMLRRLTAIDLIAARQKGVHCLRLTGCERKCESDAR